VPFVKHGSRTQALEWALAAFAVLVLSADMVEPTHAAVCVRPVG
jgi:hypothetical protein